MRSTRTRLKLGCCLSINKPLRNASIRFNQCVRIISLSRWACVDLDSMRQLLDTSNNCTACMASRGSTLRNLQQILIYVSREFGILPSSLFIQGVDCQDRDAVAGGGYGDIFQATYQGRLVALKRPRVFARDSRDGAPKVGHPSFLVFCSF